MNKKTISLFVSVIISIIVILVINDFTIVDDCLDNGGTFNYETGQCLLANNEIYVASYARYLIGFYFVFGISLAFGVSRLLKKLLKF